MAQRSSDYPHPSKSIHAGDQRIRSHNNSVQVSQYPYFGQSAHSNALYQSFGHTSFDNVHDIYEYGGHAAAIALTTHPIQAHHSQQYSKFTHNTVSFSSSRPNSKEIPFDSATTTTAAWGHEDHMRRHEGRAAIHHEQNSTNNNTYQHHTIDHHHHHQHLHQHQQKQQHPTEDDQSSYHSIVHDIDRLNVMETSDRKLPAVLDMCDSSEQSEMAPDQEEQRLPPYQHKHQDDHHQHENISLLSVRGTTFDMRDASHITEKSSQDSHDQSHHFHQLRAQDTSLPQHHGETNSFSRYHIIHDAEITPCPQHGDDYIQYVPSPLSTSLVPCGGAPDSIGNTLGESPLIAPLISTCTLPSQHPLESSQRQEAPNEPELSLLEQPTLSPPPMLVTPSLLQPHHRIPAPHTVESLLRRDFSPLDEVGDIQPAPYITHVSAPPPPLPCDCEPTAEQLKQYRQQQQRFRKASKVSHSSYITRIPNVISQDIAYESLVMVPLGKDGKPIPPKQAACYFNDRREQQKRNAFNNANSNPMLDEDIPLVKNIFSIQNTKPLGKAAYPPTTQQQQSPQQQPHQPQPQQQQKYIVSRFLPSLGTSGCGSQSTDTQLTVTHQTAQSTLK